MPIPSHVNWLIPIGTTLRTVDGKSVPVYEFQYDDSDNVVMSAWAEHFRKHYSSDIETDIFRHGTGRSRAEFLEQIKFPDRSTAPGPSLRAGDFGEILVADYVEFILNYWVPRTRYDRKTISNESTKGSDLLAFKFNESDSESPLDELLIFEAKAQFSGVLPRSRLQDAVNDSIKDEARKAESLNAVKQRLYDRREFSDMMKIERFQNKADKPYIEKYGAAALFSTNVFDITHISSNTDTSMHPYTSDLILVVIHAENAMSLVHTLYEKAANEA